MVLPDEVRGISLSLRSVLHLRTARRCFFESAVSSRGLETEEKATFARGREKAKKDLLGVFPLAAYVSLFFVDFLSSTCFLGQRFGLLNSASHF